MKKILVIKHGSLGDIISSTSVINDIKNHYKNSKIFILTTDKYKFFFSNSLFFDKILIDNRSSFFSILIMIKKIINLKFDLIIDLQNSQRTSFYALLFRLFSKIKINGTGFFSSHRYKYSSNNLPSVINGLSNQIEIMGINTTRKIFIDWLNDQSFDFNNLPNKNFFIINPGCSKKNNQKRWPADNYAEVCSFLLSKNILPIVIGLNEDVDAIKKIAQKESNILNLQNKSSLSVILQLSLKAIGAISNDTGPAHLIAASGCKIHLILSNFSNTKTVIPQGTNVTFTQKNNIKDISVDGVLMEIKKIFKI